MDSVEAEEKFQKHLAELAKMSNEEKRKYAKLLDRKEEFAVNCAKHRIECDRAAVRRATTRQGIIGVHRADLKN